MPLLPDPISTPNVKQLYLPQPNLDEEGMPLPEDKKAWVKMDVQGTNGEDMTRLYTDNLINPMGMWLTRRILEWNFIDEHGASVPITYENVIRIGKDNLQYLLNYPLSQVDALTDDQKKTSTSTSTQ